MKFTPNRRRPWRLVWPLTALATLTALLVGCSVGFSGDGPMGTGVVRETVQTGIGDDEGESGGGIRLAVLRAPQPGQRRVIFVHGTPGDAAAFIDYLNTGHPRLDLWSVDRPGFGRTRPKGTVPALADQAGVLEPLLDAPGGRKPILVGHSLGGPVVAKAAARYGDRVGGIIILAGSLDPALERIRFIQYVGEVWPIPWLIPRWLRTANREVFALKGELEVLGPELRGVRAPVTVIHGTEDKLVPYENVAYMRAAFAHTPALDVVTLDGVNHFLPWNSAPVVWQAIETMAARLDTGETEGIQPAQAPGPAR